ncbi:hypothetical protein [Aurantimonas marina]|uniref:hypothetical protein n=1 Tax=Aurantimonas marina TaxID=2780508 RepID=UPI0019D1D185|nr:hypothetical protein [Aurantimonas marina]
MWQKIKDWYQGRYVEPQNDLDAIIFLQGHYERPPLARALSRIFQFWLDHWKWIIGTMIAITALGISISR